MVVQRAAGDRDVIFRHLARTISITTVRISLQYRICNRRVCNRNVQLIPRRRTRGVVYMTAEDATFHRAAGDRDGIIHRRARGIFVHIAAGNNSFIIGANRAAGDMYLILLHIAGRFFDSTHNIICNISTVHIAANRTTFDEDLVFRFILYV